VFRTWRAITTVLVGLLCVVVAGCGSEGRSAAGGASGGAAAASGEADLQDRRLVDLGFETDFSKHSVDLDLLLSGGPAKDGIPALTDPVFVPPAMSDLDGAVRGILVELGGGRRFYPFNVLVWHEMVNDSIGDVPYLVTFCPLCGSGIVFDRRVDGEVLEFGVSGLLYESNLVMYDRGTDSLWSQSRGEAVAGSYTGTRLELVPMQFLTFEEVARSYSGVRVMSDDTGYNRDYHGNPYAGYEEDEDLMFPVSVQDERFPAKQLMYVVRVGDTSVAFALDRLGQNASATIAGRSLAATRENGEIVVEVDGEAVPGYVEMWFSWATQHQDDGHVWAME
jgi:hypothetical protein